MTGTMICFFLLQARIASATSMEQAYLTRLKSVQTAAQLKVLSEQQEELGRSKKICDFQLLQSVIPWACYRRLKLERDWNLISPSQSLEAQSKLDPICKLAAQSALRRHPQELRVPDRDLTAACLQTLKAAREVSRYRSTEIFSEGSGAEIELHNAL